jgi:hypothetical protein
MLEVFAQSSRHAGEKGNTSMIDTAICPICGQEVDGGEPGIDATENMNFCEECQRYICTDCYWPIERRCEECDAKHDTKVGKQS